VTAYKTKGLYQAADILEKYRIGSETDVSELEKHDLSMQGLRATQAKKLKRWCEAVGAVTGHFLLAKPDFSKTEVVKAYTYTIVAPAIDYWKETIEGNKGAQLWRDYCSQ
jgi:hypothetical protein